MNSKVLLIIPAYNEEANIEKVVRELCGDFPQYDYVIIDDGSKDRTSDICREGGFDFVSLPINLGIGGAVQTGYRYALEKGYDVAIQLDGDGQHDPRYVQTLIDALDEGADVAIGSRFIEKEGFQSSLVRRVGIRLLSWTVHLCTGLHVTDVTSGFRAVNRRFIKIYAESYPQDYPEPEAIVLASVCKGNVVEVPVKMRERKGGKSSIAFVKSIYYMVKVSLAVLLCRISEAVDKEKRDVD